MCLWGSAALRSLSYLHSAHTITQQCHLTAFKLRAFDLALDQFSALSKPISQSQPLTQVSGNMEGHWQYRWTQIMCQCEHLGETDTAWPTDSQRSGGQKAATRWSRSAPWGLPRVTLRSCCCTSVLWTFIFMLLFGDYYLVLPLIIH